MAIVQVSLAILFYFFTPQPIAPEGEGEFVTRFTLMSIITVVSSIVAYPLMAGALIHAVSEQYLRQTIDIHRAYRFAWKRLGAMIGATILAFLTVVGMFVIATSVTKAISSGVGAIFMVIYFCTAIYLTVRWIFIWHAALLEDLGPKPALSRSSALVKGNWWRVLGIMLVVGIIGVVISFLLVLILGVIPIVGPIIGGILSAPIAIIGATLLYYDLRGRQEGYSLESLAGELHIKMDSDSHGKNL